MIKQMRKRLAIILTVLLGMICAAIFIIMMYQAVSQKNELIENQFSSNVDKIALALYSDETESEERTEWLTSMEQNNEYVILAEVNDQTYEFTEGYQVEGSRSALYAEARQLILKEGDLLHIQGVGVANVVLGSEATEEKLEIYGETDNVVEENGLRDDVEYFEIYGTVPDIGEENRDEAMILSQSEVLELKDKNSETYRLQLKELFSTADDKISVLVLQNKKAEQKEVLLICLKYTGLLLLSLILLGLVNWHLAGVVVKPAEEGLRRQTDFVASASHELRSPLAVIRSSLAAAEIVSEETEAVKYRKNAEAEAERMSRLVEELLVLAGGDSGKWSVRRETVDLDTMLIELDEQFQTLIKEKGRILRLHLPEEMLGEVKGDPERLKQILGILLNNAMEYAPEGTEIEILAHREKNFVHISVTDHGRGISEEEKVHVFERFYRAEKSRTDKSHFGLGLAVAKELAGLHGGDIAVSDTPGGGATFTLQLPCPGSKK